MQQSPLTREIRISTNDTNQRLWWYRTWHDHGFENWSDVNAWLWDDYRAEANKTGDGFTIRFLYEDDAVLFKMTWL